VALTVWAPAVADDGIVTDDVKLPVEVVVTVAGVVATFVPSNFTVIAELAAKLLPVTVTDVPVGPLDGFSVIVATGVVVTVNVAEAEFDDASVALIVWGAAVDAGTVIVAEKLPVEVVVTVAGFVVIAVLS